MALGCLVVYKCFYENIENNQLIFKKYCIFWILTNTNSEHDLNKTEESIKTMIFDMFCT